MRTFGKILGTPLYTCMRAEHLLQLSLLDFLLMFPVKLPVVNTIQSQSNKFAVGAEDNATGDSNLNDSPVA